MAALRRADVRSWIEGQRLANRRSDQEEAARLRRLTVFESVREFGELRAQRDAQDSGMDDPELWHRLAAEDYRRLVEVFRRAHARR